MADSLFVVNEEIAALLTTYKCHKEVKACKIEAVEMVPDKVGFIKLTIANGKTLELDLDARPKPSVGWYFVLYADGYYSFSPASAFEEGYSIKE